MKVRHLPLLLLAASLGFSTPSFATEDRDEINEKIVLYLATNHVKFDKKIHVNPDCISGCQNPSFTFIFNQKNAAEIFQSILNDRSYAPAEGRIHALLGLYLLKDPDFVLYKQHFLNRKEETILTPEGKRLVKKQAKAFLNYILDTYSKE